MLPVISDPDTTFSQVISCTAVAKSTLSFHNLTSSRMVEVKQLRKISVLFIINIGRIKQNNKKQMLLKGGGGEGCNPLNPSPGSASVQVHKHLWNGTYATNFQAAVFVLSFIELIIKF